jgi:uncharacterized glyoxalase superfamily protein PhnB
MSVPARVTLITLGVHDVERASAFYRSFGWRRSSASVEGDVAFFDLAGAKLALWGRDDLASDMLRSASADPDLAAVSLAINVETEAEVDRILEEVVTLGASILKPAVRAEWGGYTGYFADPDGHAWEVAYNPGWPLDPDGSVQLPD